MQTWEWEALPPVLQPPYTPPQVCDLRAALLHEVSALMVEDLTVETSARLAIAVAHAFDAIAVLSQIAREEAAEDALSLGYDEEEEL